MLWEPFMLSFISTSIQCVLTCITITQTVCKELVISQANLGESILIFLPGITEITNYFEKLNPELNAREIDDHFSMFILHSQIPFEEQKEAFQSPRQNKTHIILATNIAESSITLSNLRMVINFGIYHQLQYDPKPHMSCLVKRWCSQSSCTQRAGRAGRVFEGVAVHWSLGILIKWSYLSMIHQRSWLLPLQS